MGEEERLLDQTIYFAHRTAEPTKYKGPSYNDGKFEKSPFQTPANTTLEIYEEMPHIFQVNILNKKSFYFILFFLIKN